MNKRLFRRLTGGLLALLLLCGGCATPEAPDASTPDGTDGTTGTVTADTTASAASTTASAAGTSTAATVGSTAPVTQGSVRTTATTTRTTTATEETVTTAFPTVGTLDLMDTAIAMSGYAESGLYDLTAYHLGVGVYADYNELHSSPLATADYVLNTRKWAGDIKDPRGLATFCRTALRKQGLRADITVHVPDTDLDIALTALFESAGDTDGLATAKKQCGDVAAGLREPLARFVSVAASSYWLIREETGDVTPEEFAALLSFAYCTPASGDIGILQKMQTAFSKVSEEMLHTAGLWMTEAACALATAAAKLPALTTSGKALTISTPAGAIRLGSMGNDHYDSPSTLLLLEPAGDDTYAGQVAFGTSLTHPLSVVIDLKGKDTYQADATTGGTQGCGVLGAGILLDMAGDDIYTAVRMAQGCAVLGTGVLYDGGGNDTYFCEVTGQAAGFYGLAVLADRSGNDHYGGYGFVQASAGTRCQAYLIDVEGNDNYYTAPDVVAGYEGLDYGQFPLVNGNWSQGCGWGQRVINVAGGIAGMLDLSGNDVYEGAIWVQGTGYWSGVGFMADTAGDDLYRSGYYSQSSVAHYGVAALVDIGGNDDHLLRSVGHPVGQGASFGFVWDRGTALFVNDGGVDFYQANCYSGGSAMSAYDEKGIVNQDLTYAVFIDTAEADYYSSAGKDSWGYGRGGYFIDAGGEDYNLGWQRYQNQMNTGLDGQEGGVYVDYEPGPDTPAAPMIGFWDRAKTAAGLS